MQLREVSVGLGCPEALVLCGAAFLPVRSGVPLCSQELHPTLGCGDGWWVVLLYSWAQILTQLRGHGGVSAAAALPGVAYLGQGKLL